MNDPQAAQRRTSRALRIPEPNQSIGPIQSQVEVHSSIVIEPMGEGRPERYRCDGPVQNGAVPDVPQWLLLRQDDHGNVAVVRRFDDAAAAEDARARFAAKGHHQHYWVEREPADVDQP